MNVIKLVIVAVGGQGNLLAARILGEAALNANVPVHMSEIHGMAQRGGVVESAIVFGDAQSSIISDNEADVLVGFEPSETLRALKKCHKDTHVITNTQPIPPFTVAIGKGIYPEIQTMLSCIQSRTKSLKALNAFDIAIEVGHVMAVNMVLLGALCQTNVLPFSSQHVRHAIEQSTKKAFLSINLAAFDKGKESVFSGIEKKP